MLMENMTWPEFEEKVKEIKTVIIPLGPMEQHGPHMPLGSDFIRPYELVKLVAEKVPVFVYPVLPIGGVDKGRYFPGSIPISGDVLTGLIYDISKWLVVHGIKKIFVLSGHNGSTHNKYIEKALADISEEFKVKAEYLKMMTIRESVQDGVIETEVDKHAGEKETSEMLFLNKELVHMDKADKEWADGDKILADLKNARKIWRTGIHGDATKATVEKGKVLIESEIEQIIKAIKE